MCIPRYVSIAVMSTSPFRSLVNRPKNGSDSIADCSRTTSSVCWTTSGGLVATTMAVSSHQFDPSLAHFPHSFAVRMPLLMWRAFSTESGQRDGELTLQCNYNKTFQSKTLTFICSRIYLRNMNELRKLGTSSYTDKGRPPSQPF